MSFRAILLGVTLGLIALSTIATTWLAASGFSRVLRSTLERQMGTTLDSVTSRIEDLFAPSRRLIRSFSSQIEEGAQSLEDPADLAIALAQALRFETDIAWISFGYPDGSFAGSRRDGDGVVINLSTPEGGKPTEWLLEPGGERVSIHRDSLPDSFDARERIWYQRALETEDKVWTDPYDFADGERGITVSKAVRGTDGTLLGVLTVDFLLRDIVAYLEDLRQKFKGDTLVFAFNGAVIATPKQIRSQEAVDHVRTLLAAEESKMHTGFDRNATILEIAVGTSHYIVGVQAADIPGNLECLSTIIFDRAESFGPIERIIKRSLLAAAMTLSLALVVGFFLAGRIAKPLRTLSQEVARIGDFDLSARPLPTSHIREVRMLSDSVVRMRSGLKSFSHYVPVDLVRDLVRKGGVASLGGEKREVTILFVDLAGFTAMAEQISPEASVELLAGFFETFGSAIDSNQGVIDKFLGDGMMALFNAPGRIPHPAAAACRAALQACQTLRTLTTTHTHDLKVRIGVLTGEALVGNIGTKERFAFTAIGDCVNLSSRLEGLNKFYGTTIIAGDSTRTQAGEEEFLWRHLDRVAVVGRNEPIDIHELMALRKQADARMIQRAEVYSRALALTLNGEPAKALETLKKILETDTPSEQLTERLLRMLSDPDDPAWRGVHQFTKK